MTIYEAMTTRRTIRRFARNPCPRDFGKSRQHGGPPGPRGRRRPSRSSSALSKPRSWSAPSTKPNGECTLKDGSGRPKPGELPVAWILICNDTTIKEQPMIHDIGAAAENIIIYVTGEGIGTCWLEAINRTAIAEILFAARTSQGVLRRCAGLSRHRAPTKCPCPTRAPHPTTGEKTGRCPSPSVR